MSSPHPDRLSGSGPEPFGACPDGGRCWHGCPLVENEHEGKGSPCWRVTHASPVGRDDWTPEEKAQHRIEDPEEVRAERDRLRRWKDEALPVMEGLQELGQALGIRPGVWIVGPEAVEAAKALQQQVADLTAERDEWREGISKSRDAAVAVYLDRALEAEQAILRVQREIDHAQLNGHVLDRNCQGVNAFINERVPAVRIDFIEAALAPRPVPLTDQEQMIEEVRKRAEYMLAEVKAMPDDHGYESMEAHANFLLKAIGRQNTTNVEERLCPTCSLPAEIPGEGRFCGSCQDYEGHCANDHCMTCGADT